MHREPILIVDDNPMNLKLIRMLLVGGGYQVQTAADAETAEALLRTWRPSLILMDIQLPGIDGLELTRRLKNDPATRGIVILALTAFAMKGDEERALAAGCYGYIAKPIDTRALPGIVADYLTTNHLLFLPSYLNEHASIPKQNLNCNNVTHSLHWYASAHDKYHYF